MCLLPCHVTINLKSDKHEYANSLLQYLLKISGEIIFVTFNNNLFFITIFFTLFNLKLHYCIIIVLFYIFVI